MALLNVRLGDDDARLVRELRERGVSISNIVREALRAEARRGRSPETLDVEALVAEMMAKHPTPAHVPQRRMAARDRQAVKALIRGKLRGKR